MKLVFAISIALLTNVLPASCLARAKQPTGNLNIVFKLKGNVPERRALRIPGRPKVLDQSFVVNADNLGIANVVVYAYTPKRGGVQVPPAPGLNRQHLLAFNNGFAPHILVTKTGDSLRIINNEAVGHSIDISFLRNDPINVLIRPKQRSVVTLEQSEPAPIPVSCNIHPWLSAYVLVLDHRWAGVSDSDGQLEITDLPTGRELVFRVFHERGTFRDEIFINGAPTKWERNRFSVEIKPGKNNLGVVEIPLQQFNLN